MTHCHTHPTRPLEDILGVTQGSVLADTYITYESSTPQSVVDASVARLQTSAEALYKQSSLPSSWGALLSYQLTADAGEGPMD